jgi:hypothetical protein
VPTDTLQGSSAGFSKAFKLGEKDEKNSRNGANNTSVIIQWFWAKLSTTNLFTCLLLDYNHLILTIIAMSAEQRHRRLCYFLCRVHLPVMSPSYNEIVS